MSDHYLTLPAASFRLQRPYVTVYGLMTAGRLGPVEKRGRTYVLTEAGVAAYLERERAKEQASKSAK